MSPSGWTGKLWAMRQGLAAVEAGAAPPEFVLFTDADIAYAPQMLRRLVAIARLKDSVLTSLMVKLRCESCGGTLAGAGLRLLLSDALSLRLGERSGTSLRRRRRAAACWRDARRSARPAAWRLCAAP